MDHGIARLLLYTGQRSFHSSNTLIRRGTCKDVMKPDLPFTGSLCAVPFGFSANTTAIPLHNEAIEQLFTIAQTDCTRLCKCTLIWLMEPRVRDWSLKQVSTIPMKEPRPCVVGHKADSDVVSLPNSNVDGVTLDRVEIVVLCCSGVPHDIKGVLSGLSSPGIRVNEDNVPRACGKDAKTTIRRKCNVQEISYRSCKKICWKGYLDDLVWR